MFNANTFFNNRSGLPKQKYRYNTRGAAIGGYTAREKSFFFHNFDASNAEPHLVRGPGINNWDLTLFKNFPVLGEQRVLQFRWEFYNIFNNTQFSNMNTTATFNAAGVMTNSQLTQATAARTGRVMQVSLRFRF